MVAWNTKVVEVVDHRIGVFSVSMLYRNKEDGFIWAFFGIYASCDQGDYETLRGIVHVHGRLVAAVVLRGDFNPVRYPFESHQIS